MSWKTSEFAARLEECKKRTGINFTALAQAMGLKHSTSISDFMSGKSRPSLEQLWRIGEIYEVSPYWLAYGKNAATPRTTEEEKAVELIRKLPETRRAAALQTMAVMAGLAMDPETEALVSKAKEKEERKKRIEAEINQTEREAYERRIAELEALNPSKLSALLVVGLGKSSSIQLTVEEAETFLKYLGSQVESMPVERPLTIAFRKLATRLDHDIALLERPRAKGKGASSAGTAGEGAASAASPAPQAGHRRTHPVLSSASHGPKDRKKK